MTKVEGKARVVGVYPDTATKAADRGSVSRSAYAEDGGGDVGRMRAEIRGRCGSQGCGPMAVRPRCCGPTFWPLNFVRPRV